MQNTEMRVRDGAPADGDESSTAPKRTCTHMWKPAEGGVDVESLKTPRWRHACAHEKRANQQSGGQEPEGARGGDEAGMLSHGGRHS